VRDKLGDEHIIPEGLGGKLRLKEASCRACEDITGAVERKVLRGPLQPTRAALKIRSKRKKPPPKAFSYWAQRNQWSPKVLRQVSREGFPFFFPFVSFNQKPRIVTGNPKGGEFEVTLSALVNPNFSKSPIYTLDRIAYVDFPLKEFTQMLAKIGHSYIMAVRGTVQFEPLLTDLALGKYWPDANYLVGGLPYPTLDGLSIKGHCEFTTPDHHISHGVVPAHDGSQIAIVELRLFGGPVYFMAAAKLL
jgi:hypothetical protein